MNPTDRLEDTVRGTYRIYAYLIGGIPFLYKSSIFSCLPVCSTRSSVLTGLGLHVRDGRPAHVVRQCFFLSLWLQVFEYYIIPEARVTNKNYCTNTFFTVFALDSQRSRLADAWGALRARAPRASRPPARWSGPPARRVDPPAHWGGARRLRNSHLIRFESIRFEDNSSVPLSLSLS